MYAVDHDWSSKQMSSPAKRRSDVDGKEYEDLSRSDVENLRRELQTTEALAQRYRAERDTAIEEKKATEDNYNRAISEAESERDAARQLANQAAGERDAAQQAAIQAAGERDAARQLANQANANRDAAIQAANQAGRERDVAIQAANQATANGNAAAQAALQAIRERDEAKEEAKNMAGRLAVTEASLNETQAGLERAQEEADEIKRNFDAQTEELKRAYAEARQATAEIHKARKEEEGKRIFLMGKCDAVTATMLDLEKVWVGDETQTRMSADWNAEVQIENNNPGDRVLYMAKYVRDMIMRSKPEILELQKLKKKQENVMEFVSEETKTSEVYKKALDEILPVLLNIEAVWVGEGRGTLQATLNNRIGTGVDEKTKIATSAVLDLTKTNLQYIKAERQEVKTYLRAVSNMLGEGIDERMNEVDTKWETATSNVIAACKRDVPKLESLREQMQSLSKGVTAFNVAGQSLFGEIIGRIHLESKEPGVFVPGLVKLLEHESTILKNHINSVLELQQYIRKRQEEKNVPGSELIQDKSVEMARVIAWVTTQLLDSKAVMDVSGKFLQDMVTVRSRFPVESLPSYSDDNGVSFDVIPDDDAKTVTKKLHAFFVFLNRYYIDLWTQIGKTCGVAKTIRNDVKEMKVDELGDAEMPPPENPLQMAKYSHAMIEDAKKRLDDYKMGWKELTAAFVDKWKSSARVYDETWSNYTRASVLPRNEAAPRAANESATLRDEKEPGPGRAALAPKEPVSFRPAQGGVSGSAHDISEFVTRFIDRAVADYEGEMKSKTKTVEGLKALTLKISSMLTETHLADTVPSQIRIDTIATDLTPFIDAMITLVAERSEVYVDATASLSLAYKSMAGVEYSVPKLLADKKTFAILKQTATDVKMKAGDKEREEKEMFKAVEEFGTGYLKLAQNEPVMTKMDKQAEKELKEKELKEKKALAGAQSSPALAAPGKREGGRDEKGQLEKEKKTGVVTGLDKQAELEKKEQQEEEEKARVVRDDLSRSIRTPAGVVHVLRKTKQYADSYAEKVKTFHDEAEAQYKVVEAAVATLAHETGQQFTKSYFSHGAYTAIASVIASSAGEYKNLKHETTAAAKTIDRALVRLVTELNVTKQFTHLESLDDADNTATSIDGIREEYERRQDEDNKAVTGTYGTLSRLPRPFFDATTVVAGTRVTAQIKSIVDQLRLAIEAQQTDAVNLYMMINKIDILFLQATLDEKTSTIQSATGATDIVRQNIDKQQRQLAKIYALATNSMKGSSVRDVSGLESFVNHLLSERPKKPGTGKKSGVGDIVSAFDSALIIPGSAAKRQLEPNGPPDDNDRTRKANLKRAKVERTFWSIYSFAQLVSGRVNTHPDSDTRLLKLPLVGNNADKGLIFSMAIQIYKSIQTNDLAELRAVVDRAVADLDTRDTDDNVERFSNRFEQRAAVDRQRAQPIADEKKDAIVGRERREAKENGSDVATPVFNLVVQFKRYDAMIRDDRFTEVVQMAVMPALVAALMELRDKLDQQYPAHTTLPVSVEEMICTPAISNIISIMCSESINTQKAQNATSFVSSAALTHILTQEKSTFEQFRRTYVRHEAFDWKVTPHRSRASRYSQLPVMRISI